MSLRLANNSGFSLVELMVVIAIVVLMAVLAAAPYSYYSDLTKVRLSGEKIEQTFSEAKLSAAMGLAVPGTDSNGDAYVVLSKGSGSVALFAAKSGSGFAAMADYKLLRAVPLEKDVTVTELPSATVTVKFSAPSGTSSAVDENGLPISFSGGVVGFGGASTGTLSRVFRSVSAY